MGSITLTAELVARGPAAAFVLDDEQVAIVGEGAKRFPVVATVNSNSVAPRSIAGSRVSCGSIADSGA